MEWSRGDPVAESGGLGGKLHGHAMTMKVSCDVVPALVLNHGRMLMLIMLVLFIPCVDGYCSSLAYDNMLVASC